MATRYFKAAGGNFNGANWSATSSAGIDSLTPTAADDCIMELGSGACTINTGSVCRSLNTTSGTGSYGGTLTHTASVIFSIGDGTAGAGSVALKLNSGMTYAPGASQVIQFISTSATVQTIDSGGKTLPAIIWSGAGGSWQLATNFTSQAACYFYQGTLDLNSKTVSLSSLDCTTTGTRTLTMGSAAVTLVGGFCTFASTGLTVTANTGSINISVAAANFAGGGVNFNGMTLNLTGAGAAAISGANTFGNLNRTGTATTTCSLGISANQTITGTLTTAGNSNINRLLVGGGPLGTAITLTAATVTASYVNFIDITGAGAASWNLAAITGNSGDLGGNSGITFTTPATQNVTMSTNKNWSDVTIYTSRIPLPQDNVTFTGVTGGILSSDMPYLGKDIDWTGATGTPTWSINTSAVFNFGSIKLVSGMTVSGAWYIFTYGRGSHTLTSNGVTWGAAVGLATGVTGTYTLQDDWVITGNLYVDYNSTWDANGKNVTAATVNNNTGASYGSTIKLGSGTWTVTGTTGSVWNIPQTTVVSTGSTIVLNTSASARTFVGNSQTYNTLTYTVAGSVGSLTLTGSNTFTNINFSDVTNARSLLFTAATTTTIINNFNVNGTAGKLMTIGSATAANHNLVKASGGRVSCDYLSISRSQATPTLTWYAGANSTDGANNTGWVFTVPPALPRNLTASGVG